MDELAITKQKIAKCEKHKTSEIWAQECSLVLPILEVLLFDNTFDLGCFPPHAGSRSLSLNLDLCDKS